MTTFRVSFAAPGDMAALEPLMREMLTFHGGEAPLPPDAFATRLEADGPAGRGAYECLIARRAADTDAIGFAMYSTVYEAAFPGDGVFLRDIFVTEAARGTGVGRALMVALARTCRERGWNRIDWHADRLDLDARTFYELVAPDSFRLNRLSYRVDAGQIEALAALGGDSIIAETKF
jgi:GNAT superfamily N-acetyltransferase